MSLARPVDLDAQEADWSRVVQLLEQGCVPLASFQQGNASSGVYPGAVLLVSERGEIKFHAAVGHRSLLPELSKMSSDMVFDVSSLTKPLIAATLAMKLFESGKLDIDSRLSRIFQTFVTNGKERMTVRHLLNHTAGYPASVPFYRQIVRASNAERAGMFGSRGAVEYVYNEIFRMRPSTLPGKATRYSDVGFILLGAVLESVSGGVTLDKLADRLIFKPLQLRSSGFIESAKIRRGGLKPVTDMIVPTVRCSWRNRILCGEVHDENAAAMGGVAAHAGLFSSAMDVHTIANELLNAYHGRSSYLSKEVVREFWKADAGSWALGWDKSHSAGSGAGRAFSKESIGHLGYTGCSLWIDPEKEVEVILLTNRIHPSDTNVAIRDFRPALHDAIMETLGYTTE